MLVHRDDLQGLRAVAVLVVVLDHAGLGLFSGGYVGVDVFFVLSGFLITGLLLSRAAEQGRVSLSEFYVRRARRILPAAVLTLVATDIVAYQLLNFVRAREAVIDSIWASFFVANVHFAQTGSDYLAQAQPPSPVQQFWTLSVEEQFYLVWPAVLSLVLFGALGVLGLRRKGSLGPAALRRALIVVAAGGLFSLLWSIHSTRTTPATAYYSSLTRAWELALGAALAIAAAQLSRMPSPLQLVSGWTGLGCIAVAAVAFSSSTPFPGYAALLPALGAALVIAAGIRRHRSRAAVSGALSLPPLRYVGDRSYAFYLWHWPVLVIAAEYAGHELSIVVRILLLVGAFLLSMLSYAVFENPIRQMRLRAPKGAILWPASAVIVLAVALPILGSLHDTAARIAAASAAVRPASLVKVAATTRTGWKPLPAVGAAVKAAQRGAPIPSPLTPPVGSLRGDFYTFPSACSASNGQTSSSCRLGDTQAAKTIVVIGDSHAQTWMPTILRLANRDSWVVAPLVKLGCVPSSWLRSGLACGKWYHWAVRQAASIHPQVSLLVGSWADSHHPAASVKGVAGLIDTTKRFSASVIVLGDSPHQRRDPVDCLLASGATMKTCTSKATARELQTNAAVVAAAAKRKVGFMNAIGWFCGRGSNSTVPCPLVINQTIAWIDQGHISRTYGLELAPVFRAAFRRELFR